MRYRLDEDSTPGAYNATCTVRIILHAILQAALSVFFALVQDQCDLHQSTVSLTLFKRDNDTMVW